MTTRADRVTIRLARAGDLEELSLLRSELRREEREVALDRTDDEGGKVRALTRRQLAGPQQVFFVAVFDEVMVGMVRCALWSSPDGGSVATLTTAYVSPAHRRRGIMRQLVEAATSWSQERGASDLRLRNHVSNSAAGAVWESLGFEVVQVVRRRTLPR